MLRARAELLALHFYGLSETIRAVAEKATGRRRDGADRLELLLLSRLRATTKEEEQSFLQLGLKLNAYECARKQKDKAGLLIFMFLRGKKKKRKTIPPAAEKERVVLLRDDGTKFYYSECCDRPPL